MEEYCGPLTTTFTPPSSCLNGQTLYRHANSAAVKILDAPECFPTNYVTTGFYSPGLFCPVGYQATTQSDGIETTLNCCPNEFEYISSSIGVCISIDFSTTFAVFVTAEPATTTSTQYYSNPSASIGADVIQLRYKSSDIVTSTAASTNSASSTNPTRASSTATSPLLPTKSGLSTGAKVAIGVVVPVVVLGALVLIGFLFNRRRKPGRREAGAAQLSELPADSAIVEMATVPTLRESK